MFEDKNTENRKLQNLQKQNTGIVKIENLYDSIFRRLKYYKSVKN